MEDAYSRASKNGKTPEEPDYVASLVKLGVINIKRALDQVFSGTGVTISTTGVFCHQSPMVKFTLKGKRERCELGDLLLIHSHTDKAGVVQRNALLLQAKMTEPSVRKKAIPKAEQHQLGLYQHWPIITYDMSGGTLNGKKRLISPQSRHAGAQYLLIDSDRIFSTTPVPAGHYPMGIWMAETPLFSSCSFGKVFFDFLSMASGRPFGEKATAQGWSGVIWDLVENGLKKGFSRARTNHVSTPGSRHSGDHVPQLMCCYTLGFGSTQQSIVGDILGPASNVLRSLNNNGVVPPEVMGEFNFDEPPAGISLVIIETDESRIE